MVLDENLQEWYIKIMQLFEESSERTKMDPELLRVFNDLPNKSLLRPDEVGAFLSVSEKTVRRWVAEGVIRGVRLGKSIRIFRDSLVDWIGPDR
jgi:excisionase family DNA binding protein